MSGQAAALAPAVDRRRRAGNSQVLAFVRAQPLGAAAFLIILLLAFAAVFAEQVAPFDPVAIDFAAMLSPPSATHLLGTDDFGRDILSSAAGCTVGAAIGISSAYAGGTADLVIQRFVDILLSFPIIVLAMVVVAVLGRNLVAGVDVNLTCAIAIPIVPRAARVLRSAALAIRAMPYVDAARAAGYSDARIIVRHMAPNVLAPYRAGSGFLVLPHFAWIMPLAERGGGAGRSWRDHTSGV